MMTEKTVIHGVSLFAEQDVYLFKEGRHFRLHEKLGAHVRTVEGVTGTHFSVWAPNAQKVSVIGDFNGWDTASHLLSHRWDGSGIWEGFIAGLGHGTLYKYHIQSKQHHYTAEKSDPVAFYSEMAPKTASIVWDLNYSWNDAQWMRGRGAKNSHVEPVSVYELHLGSWRRVPDENNRHLSYRESAHALADYVKDMGFTHVEIMPVLEHPFYGSWGYQATGYFSPTSRYGTPQDFMAFVDVLHQNGIGVILDWVPSHFPSDAHGLVYFDGTHLYEHADPKKGFHPDWNSLIFNYGRHEVCAFLISSAVYWLEKYHVDGLRVDGVASMLYLDYSRQAGEWIPNAYGGRENLEAISFIRALNEEVYRSFPDVQTVAEESTAWPMVSRPTYVGGLGFGMKWNMGWMHDTLKYFSKDPVHRKFHHDELTFSLWYAFHENFVLPLSHDEVVHGKGSILGRMPGDDWQRFANLRLLFGYFFAHPGKKLLFMGAEFGARREWAHDESLEWHLLQYAPHQGVQQWVRDLNALYRSEPALHEVDFREDGFEWLDYHDWENSVFSFIRKPQAGQESVLVACNFTPVPRHNYVLNVPESGYWKEILNSDAQCYGGSGIGNLGGAHTQHPTFSGARHALSVHLPPLGILFLKKE